MKRELKVLGEHRLDIDLLKSFKTDPDEKGTESRPSFSRNTGTPRGFKTDPDEKGTERRLLP